MPLWEIDFYYLLAKRISINDIFKRGCTFQGTAHEVEEHTKKCSYEQLKPYLEKNEEEIELLQLRVKSQDLEIEFLKKKLTQILSTLNEVSILSYLYIYRTLYI